MSLWEFDLELLAKLGVGWVPFDVRYGYRKIANFTRKTPRWPAEPGTLWERVTS